MSENANHNASGKADRAARSARLNRQQRAGATAGRGSRTIRATSGQEKSPKRRIGWSLFG